MQTAKLKRLGLATLGCRLNQYETEKMGSELLKFGFERADEWAPADLYLINTCTVTHKADASSRQIVNRLIRENPHAKIVVAGCLVDNDAKSVKNIQGVDAVIGNSEKERIAEILPKLFPDLFSAEPDKNCSATVADFAGHNRAWVKISDGCNQWCAFCIIPTVRGRLKNRNPLEIIAEIRGLVNRGYNEVVLTGVNIGHYRFGGGGLPISCFSELMRTILAETDIRRLRVSSIEPQTVRQDVSELYVDGDKRICRHWHLPLQSGSDRILKAMRRPYDVSTYVERAKRMKSARPNTIIGADVIVGFPGETEDDFKRTEELCKSGLIDYLHVFSYSDRRDTAASKMANKVRPVIIKDRSRRLSQLSVALRTSANNRQVGQVLEVIAEGKDSDRAQLSIADNYIKVRMPVTVASQKEIVRLKITGSNQDHAIGQATTGQESLC